MNEFRKEMPIRTCTKKYKSYGSFKPYLADDFNHKCGYTDCPDYWFDGQNSFHIDHFKPKKTNPKLETEYSNLVYSCSYVNNSKSDKENPYFLDPCNHDFNDHFQRDSIGRIIPKSMEGIVMFKEFNLSLIRYQLIWLLDEILNRVHKLYKLEEKHPESNEIKAMLADLNREFHKYFRYLKMPN